jgi:hypothetical protein
MKVILSISEAQRFVLTELNSRIPIPLNQVEIKPDPVESWFNIITPKEQTLKGLHAALTTLSKKNWKEIHSV